MNTNNRNDIFIIMDEGKDVVNDNQRDQHLQFNVMMIGCYIQAS